MEAVPPMWPLIGATHLETKTDNNFWKIYFRKDWFCFAKSIFWYRTFCTNQLLQNWGTL